MQNTSYCFSQAIESKFYVGLRESAISVHFR